MLCGMCGWITLHRDEKTQLHLGPMVSWWQQLQSNLGHLILALKVTHLRCIGAGKTSQSTSFCEAAPAVKGETDPHSGTLGWKEREHRTAGEGKSERRQGIHPRKSTKGRMDTAERWACPVAGCHAGFHCEGHQQKTVSLRTLSSLILQDMRDTKLHCVQQWAARQMLLRSSWTLQHLLITCNSVWCHSPLECLPTALNYLLPTMFY